MSDGSEPLERLESDGLLRRDGEEYRTTRRFQGAMARATLRLLVEGQDGDDLRVPIAAALAELYEELSDAAIAELVEAVLPVEAAEVDPRAPRVLAPAR